MGVGVGVVLDHARTMCAMTETKMKPMTDYCCCGAGMFSVRPCCEDRLTAGGRWSGVESSSVCVTLQLRSSPAHGEAWTCLTRVPACDTPPPSPGRRSIVCCAVYEVSMSSPNQCDDHSTKCRRFIRSGDCDQVGGPAMPLRLCKLEVASAIPRETEHDCCSRSRGMFIRAKYGDLWCAYARSA